MLEHTLVGEVPVEVAPGELLLDVASGLEGGKCLDHLRKRRLFINLCQDQGDLAMNEEKGYLACMQCFGSVDPEF